MFLKKTLISIEQGTFLVQKLKKLLIFSSNLLHFFSLNVSLTLDLHHYTLFL